ncbi:MAG: exosome complex exonuclease Rrp41 [Candidatus Lokiarchaeota archaeon]|nr:exosome complex exonuclease Rrp41 [Candidatus Lokiarchaeota archaeon]
MTILIPEEYPKKLIDKNGKRLDGRALDELRPFSCKIGVLANADGSAYVEHGKNKIYAGVYGPREVHPRHLARPDRGIIRVDYRMTTFSVHERKSPAPNRREREISKIIEDALAPTLFLELYPNSAIEVYVQVIAADGGTRCASTTAASLALADAGLPLKSLVAAVAAGKADGEIILDLGDLEDKAGTADVPAAVRMIDEEFTLLQFDGEMTPEEFEKSIKLIKKGAREIFAKQTAAIKEKFDTVRKETEEENKKIEKLVPPEEKITHASGTKEEEKAGEEKSDKAEEIKEEKEDPSDTKEEEKKPKKEKEEKKSEENK